VGVDVGEEDAGGGETILQSLPTKWLTMQTGSVLKVKPVECDFNGGVSANISQTISNSYSLF
jgi:hypothetical protein